jgi:hypothetical protein
MEKSPKNKGGRRKSLQWLPNGVEIQRLMAEGGINSEKLAEKAKVPTGGS